jgi:hypothetical protein
VMITKKNKGFGKEKSGMAFEHFAFTSQNELSEYFYIYIITFCD